MERTAANAAPLLNRDLEAARDAYNRGDATASRDAHNQHLASEQHQEGGGRLKSIVFGGLDGILTSFAIVSGAVGAHLGPTAVLAMGISNVLADALSMGAGEYLSSKAYSSYVRQEMEREKWELHNHPEGEVQEMVELFHQRGMSIDDAQVVVERMAKYKDFFINIMMTEELQLPVPSDDAAAESLRDGFVMFLAFAAFGLVPILAFAVVPIIVPGLDDHVLFGAACAVTGVSLFGLGAYKALFHDKKFFRSGLETLVLGSVCASVAFLVGRAVSNVAEDGLSDLWVHA